MGSFAAELDPDWNIKVRDDILNACPYANTGRLDYQR